MRLFAAITALAVAGAGCGDATSPAPPLKLVATISPPLAGNAVAKCQKIQLTPTVQDEVGATVMPDSTRWASSDTTLATISATGLVHALGTTPKVTVEALVYKLPRRGSVQASFAISQILPLPPPPPCTP